MCEKEGFLSLFAIMNLAGERDFAILSSVKTICLTTTETAKVHAK